MFPFSSTFLLPFPFSLFEIHVISTYPTLCHLFFEDPAANTAVADTSTILSVSGQNTVSEISTEEIRRVAENSVFYIIVMPLLLFTITYQLLTD